VFQPRSSILIGGGGTPWRKGAHLQGEGGIEKCLGVMKHRSLEEGGETQISVAWGEGTRVTSERGGQNKNSKRSRRAREGEKKRKEKVRHHFVNQPERERGKFPKGERRVGQIGVFPKGSSLSVAKEGGRRFGVGEFRSQRPEGVPFLKKGKGDYSGRKQPLPSRGNLTKGGLSLEERDPFSSKRGGGRQSNNCDDKKGGSTLSLKENGRKDSFFREEGHVKRLSGEESNVKLTRKELEHVFGKKGGRNPTTGRRRERH